MSQELSHLCTLAGAALQLPLCRSAAHSTTSATLSSLPTSHGLLASAEFMARKTAALSLGLPSLSWKVAMSTQLSMRVELTALCFWPNRDERKRAMLPSPSMGHMVWTLNFI